ncbi:MAG: NADH-quinone oxidoreductase subunit D, partial [Hymenobacter sp.]
MAVNDALAGTHKIIEEAQEQQGGQLVPTLNDFSQELTTLNLGPTHPATHGIFQNILQM